MVKSPVRTRLEDHRREAYFQFLFSIFRRLTAILRVRATT
jgi:hypothetical protein